MVHRTKQRYDERDRGVALILVLLAILVLTTLAAAMVFSARTNTLASYNYRIGTQAEYVARAGLQKALNFFNSTSYSPVSPTNAQSTYNVSIYANNPVNLYFANATPVICATAAPGCSTKPVFLGTSSFTSNYPNSSVLSNTSVNVVNDWVNNLVNQSLSNGMGGTGNFTVTAQLMDYHTVNNAMFGVPPPGGCPSDILAPLGICRQSYEVWQVTSTGTWNSNLSAGASSPTVALVATIGPLYLTYSGMGIYGMCGVTIAGNVCTDAYNSSVGNYNANAYSCVTPSTSTTNANATGGNIGSNGGVTINGGSNTIGGNVIFANQALPPNTSACNTGFSGSTNGVSGSVLPGPAVPVPPMPTITGTGTATAVSPSSTRNVVNVYMNPGYAGAYPKPAGAASSCPTGGANTGFIESYNESDTCTLKVAGKCVAYSYSYSNYTCTAITGAGTSASPYVVGDVTANSSNPGTINFIGPANGLTDPVYVSMNSINVGTGGAITTSSAPPNNSAGVGWGTWTFPAIGTTPYGSAVDSKGNTIAGSSPGTATSTAPGIVMNVAGNLNLSGQSDTNFNPATPGVPSPDFLRMFVEGTSISLSGQAQLSAVIVAPNASASLGGSGSTGTFFGSLLANNVTDHGNYPFHYDMATKNQSGEMFTSQVMSVTRPKM